MVICEMHILSRWEKYQSEEEAALGRGKRQRKAVFYREAYATQPTEMLNEVLPFFLIHKSSQFHEKL